VWQREEGVAVVERIGAAVAPHGCKVNLVGSVAGQGWCLVELRVDGDGKVLERTVGAVDAIRACHPLVRHVSDQVLFLDGAFRPIEMWLNEPQSFQRGAEAIRKEMSRREREDDARLRACSNQAFEREPPPDGMEHVPQIVFEQQVAAVILMLRERSGAQ
jgi:hypothetical protein